MGRNAKGVIGGPLLVCAWLGLWSSPLAGAAAPGPAPGAPAPGSAPGVRSLDHRGDALLKRMSDALRKHQRFGVVIDEASEVFVKGGRNVRFVSSSAITVERPNRMRMDRRGDLVDVSLFYDGKAMTIWRRTTNFFASVAAPPTLDRALDFARDRIEIDIPASELLGGDPSRALGRVADTAEYAGREAVRGVDCHHLVLRGAETDLELWIEDGDRPLPAKLVVTAKGVTGSPTVSSEFRNWRFDPMPANETFTFEPPPGAERIPLLEMIETLPRPQTRER